MSKQFDYLVFVGRFGPFHEGHNSVLQYAFQTAKNVIVLVGSSYRPRTIKNPWTFQERKQMLMDSLTFKQQNQLIIRSLNDIMYNEEAWIQQVQQVVTGAIICNETGGYVDNPSHNMKDLKIGIIGYDKDETSAYLKLFPQWTKVGVNLSKNIHAEDIRTILFKQRNFSELKELVPNAVYESLRTFTLTKEFKQLISEYDHIQKYKQSWLSAPYAPTFLTADVVVIQSGHILLVIRDAVPGEGLLALPGGFVNTNEFIECAALRELKEETKIDVPVKVLRGNIKDSHIFDHPLRSLRGRTVTQAFLIELPPGPLPKVKGSDDARHAMWVPFNDLTSENMFEDHYDVLRFFLKC